MHDGRRDVDDYTMTPGPGTDAPERSYQPSSATPVEAKPESEAEADHADTTPNSAPVIESANAIAEPRRLPTDAPGEASDLNAAPTPRPEPPSDPPAVATASRVLADAPIQSPAADVLGFSRHSVPISEADSVARVDVRRVGNATGDISFQWYTVAESATPVRDYVFEFGEERMAPGQTTATLVVPIVADSIHEDPELLQVVIANPRGARVGPAGRVPIIIVDDD